MHSWCFGSGTLDTQLHDSGILDSEIRAEYCHMFTLTLAAAAFLIPVVGFIIDRCGYTVTYVLTVSFAVLWSSMLVSGVEQLLVPSFVCYALFRTFVFTFMFAYLADTMGFRYYGALSGLLFLICGLVGLLQYPVAHWARRTCPEQSAYCASARWDVINKLMTFSFVFSYVFCLYEYFDRRKFPLKVTAISLDIHDDGQTPLPVESKDVVNLSEETFLTF